VVFAAGARCLEKLAARARWLQVGAFRTRDALLSKRRKYAGLS